MNILLLTQYYPPEFGACAARNAEHAALWAAAGHQVEVCTGFPNYPTGVIPPEYEDLVYQCEKRDGVILHRIHSRHFPNRNILQRAWSSWSFFSETTRWCRRCCKKPDLIVASSGPFFVGILGYILSRLYRVPFILEVRDLIPQQAKDAGLVKNNFILWALNTVSNFLYHSADRVVAVAEDTRKFFIELGIDETLCTTIENGIRDDFFKPLSGENFYRTKYGWQDKYVALFSGVHGVSQHLETLVEVAELLRTRQDIHFVFVGDGAEKANLVKLAHSKGLKNCEFLPIQDKSMMPQLYNAADVCFVPLRRGRYFTLNIPSKMFEIMGCGRPMILGATGQSRRIMKKANAGIAVNAESIRGYIRAILRLYDNPDQARQFGENGRQFVIDHFARSQKAERYLELMDQLLQ